ncbi:site-specific integrase [Nocardia vinacea]|uniref:Site-specific integrase n=1 Tax=Nocardia vinacea TaxID=96468 RepID=A0ABZ1YWV7_9NOCA|nr:site-specific integrase [Nocardia vinacea]
MTGKPVWDVVTYYSEAEAVAHDARHTLKSGKGSLSGRSTQLTVTEAVDEWAESLAVDPNTVVEYKYLLQPLRAAHGAQPVRKLHRKQLMLLRDQLRAGTCPHPTATGRKRGAWNASMVNKMLDKCESVLEMLRDEGYLDHNHAALTPRLRERRTNQAAAGEPKRGVFTLEEIGVILGKSAEHSVTMFVLCLLAFCGLRKGEIAGLRWDRIDFDTGRMWVSEQRKRNRRNKADRADGEGSTVVGDTKTEESERELPLPPILATVLKSVRRWQLEMHMATGRRFGVDGEPPTHVVANRSGGPIHPDTAYEKWADYVHRLDVLYLHLHAARDTCATVLALRGVLPHLIGAWLGHKAKGSIASPVTGKYIHGEWEFRVIVAEHWEAVFAPIVTNCDMKYGVRAGKRQVSA